MAPGEQVLADRILDKALALGEAKDWEAVQLHAVADALSISLEDVRRFYAQKDDLANAWFDRADGAVLEQLPSEEFLALDLSERLQRVIMTWLEALERHRRLTRQMLAYKLEFGHLHLQVLGLMRISRTVQWFREAARENGRGLDRIVGEITLTGIYLATFGRWLYDDSPDFQATRSFLERALKQRQSLTCNRCGETAAAAG